MILHRNDFQVSFTLFTYWYGVLRLAFFGIPKRVICLQMFGGLNRRESVLEGRTLIINFRRLPEPGSPGCYEVRFCPLSPVSQCLRMKRHVFVYLYFGGHLAVSCWKVVAISYLSRDYSTQHSVGTSEPLLNKWKDTWINERKEEVKDRRKENEREKRSDLGTHYKLVWQGVDVKSPLQEIPVCPAWISAYFPHTHFKHVTKSNE